MAKASRARVPVSPPQLGEAEGIAQPINGVPHISVNQLRTTLADDAVVRLINT